MFFYSFFPHENALLLNPHDVEIVSDAATQLNLKKKCTHIHKRKLLESRTQTHFIPYTPNARFSVRTLIGWCFFFHFVLLLVLGFLLQHDLNLFCLSMCWCARVI